MIKIPFLDLDAAYKELKTEIENSVLRSLRSGTYIGGPVVEEFESDFSTYTQTLFCVSVANGLDALYLALHALDIGVGDEVIVPSNTYIATWLAISRCGAKPVPVEPDPITYNMDPTKIEAAITEKTKLILPVHIYGQPADLDPILEIAARYNFYVLEDAAQAHGARYKGKRIGGHGSVVAWSFYPGKNLGAFGDGGAITTNDPEIAHRIRILRNYGSKDKYINIVKGFNSRLDPVQAAVLSVKLKFLDEWNDRRSLIALQYDSALRTSDLIIPQNMPGSTSAWHLYVVQHPKRDQLRELLMRAGVHTMIHYPVPPHLQAAYTLDGYKLGQFPIAEQIARQAISLPMGPHLGLQAIVVIQQLLKCIQML